MSGQDSAGETGGEEEEEKEVWLGETKARDDLEDCDVADSQLTCSPSLPHWPRRVVECAVLVWSAQGTFTIMVTTV